jgi:hypothetical protein
MLCLEPKSESLTSLGPFAEQLSSPSAARQPGDTYILQSYLVRALQIRELGKSGHASGASLDQVYWNIVLVLPQVYGIAL